MRWFICLMLIAGCMRGREDPPQLMTIRGFSGPEAVRYDPDQDVWFVANFNGEAEGDSNGFISRVDSAGSIIGLRFMTGTMAPMHGPRGMCITGDTLWAVDADGVQAFNRKTGAHLAFIDFRSFKPAFLNDITSGPDGALYITDTNSEHPRVLRLAGREVTIAIEDQRLGPPNGITWDSAGGRFLLAGWGAGGTVTGWRPGTTEVVTVGIATSGRFDGIEMVHGVPLVASQSDSSLHLISNGGEAVIIQTAGAPADIGVDWRRRLVAVPYIDLNRVDVWRLHQ
jgi:DNA-binding beta-propeller fold protein YncE